MQEMITLLREKIIALQTNNLQQKDLQQKSESTSELKIEQIAINLIDILDLYSLNFANDSQLALTVLKKSEKRLCKILSLLDVENLQVPQSVEASEHVKVVSTRVSSSHRNGEVIEVVRKGYRKNNKILRPIEVVVCQ